MKHTRRLLLLILILGGVAWVAYVIARTYTTPIGTVESAGEDLLPPWSPDLACRWSIFRGGRELCGVASGELGDSLRFRWRFKTGSPVTSSPVVEAGRVFVGSGDGNVYAIDLARGGKIWSFKTEGAVDAPPLVVDGSVFVGSRDFALYCLDAATGTQKWRYQTGAEIEGSANWIGSSNGQEKRILFGGYDGKLYCLDPRNGLEVWTHEAESYIYSTPAADGDKVIFAGCDKFLRIVSASDGDELAKVELGAPVIASAAIRDGRAYVGTLGEGFLCVDLAAARTLWCYEDCGDVYSCAAVDDEYVVFGSRDNRVHCLRPEDGEVLWTFPTRGHVDCSPVICGGKVVVGSDDGRLYVLRLADGAKIWSYEIGQAISSSPAVCDGAVIVGCDDGFVYVFR